MKAQEAVPAHCTINQVQQAAIDAIMYEEPFLQSVPAQEIAIPVFSPGQNNMGFLMENIDLYLFNKYDIEEKWTFFCRSAWRPGHRPETFLRASRVRRTTIWGHRVIPALIQVSASVSRHVVSTRASVKCAPCRYQGAARSAPQEGATGLGSGSGQVLVC